MRQIDGLIRRHVPGSSEELAEKVHLSRSAFMGYIHEMKVLGFPIGYDKRRQRFYYEKEGRMISHFFEEALSDEESKKVKGGVSFSENSQAMSREDDAAFSSAPLKATLAL